MSIAKRSGPPRILILEDEPLILMEMSFAVEDEGAAPIGVNTVDRALSAIDADRPDAAILDVTLGRGETCERVARRLEEIGVPFLLHSGDLMRQGELIARIDAELIPKPAASNQVAERAVSLVASGSSGAPGAAAP